MSSDRIEPLFDSSDSDECHRDDLAPSSPTSAYDRVRPTTGIGPLFISRPTEAQWATASAVLDWLARQPIGSAYHDVHDVAELLDDVMRGERAAGAEERS